MAPVAAVIAEEPMAEAAPAEAEAVEEAKAETTAPVVAVEGA